MNKEDMKRMLFVLGKEHCLDVMINVYKNDWQTASEVARDLNIHIATAVKYLTELYELGLVNRVVPQDELMAEAERWAEKIAANAPLALVAMKRLFRHGLTEDFESHTHHVLMQLLLLFRSRDFKEGIQSFLERREPQFGGN